MSKQLKIHGNVFFSATSMAELKKNKRGSTTDPWGTFRAPIHVCLSLKKAELCTLFLFHEIIRHVIVATRIVFQL